MTSARGLSGATVVVTENEAIKVAGANSHRVVAQGAWLLRHPQEHLPRVYTILRSGYSMERLTPTQTSYVDLDATVNALRDSVWRYAPTWSGDTPRTMVKVARILETYAPQLVAPVLERVAYIRPTSSCLTHGDPTAENVMLRSTQYVVTDPVPSTVEVPDDMAVDVGKLLQSAHGWETLKGEGRSTWTAQAIAEYFDDELFDVGQLWCIVHFVRTLPYAPKEVKPRVLDKVNELLVL